MHYTRKLKKLTMSGKPFGCLLHSYERSLVKDSNRSKTKKRNILNYFVNTAVDVVVASSREDEFIAHDKAAVVIMLCAKEE